MNIKKMEIGINLKMSWKLKRFVDAGKIREIGLSNETPWGVIKISRSFKRKKSYQE